MPEKTFTLTTKLEAIKREIRMRRRVYPGRVERGTMSRVEADRQIAIMEAIAEDYEQQIAEHEPSLF